MDSITHIALGACIGEVLLTPKVGKRALLLGAVAQSLPDIDFIASFFLPSDAALLAHRGLTHSVLFAIVAGILLAVLLKRFHNGRPIPFAYLALFFILQLLIHDLLDTCNAYGTGLLEPFSHQRFSIHLLYVADPLFSICLVIAALMLTIRTGNKYFRRRWAIIGLLPSLIYLCISGMNKWIVDQKAQTTFAVNNIKPDQYLITPTPFNDLLWYIVARKGKIYYTGYHSVFDPHDQPVRLTQFSNNDSLLNEIPDNHVRTNLLLFAEGYYTVERRADALIFNVLRFGQVQGWIDPHAPFVFHYYLNADSNNTLAVQRGRFEGWTVRNVTKMLRRMAGKQLIDTSYSKKLK